jgi:hypothetical protein
VSFVDTTADLSEAQVFISALKDEEEILEVLNKQSGHIDTFLVKELESRKHRSYCLKKIFLN